MSGSDSEGGLCYFPDFLAHAANGLASGDPGAGSSPARAAMDGDSHAHFDDAFELGKRIGAGGLGTVHTCRARGKVNEKRPRDLPLVVKTVRVRSIVGERVREGDLDSSRFDAEIDALRRLDACAERDSNAASTMFPKLVAAFRHVEKHSEGAEYTLGVARVVTTNPWGASSCDLSRLRASARDRYGDENVQFPESEAQFYAAQIVVALRYLHARAKLAHGDVKPENVLVHRNTGAVALCDFDLARATEGVRERRTSKARSDDDRIGCEVRGGVASRVDDDGGGGGIVGTPEYVAPEVARGVVAGATAQTDWYQLGVLVYELRFGQTPFASPFGVVGSTLRAIEANDLRFFDALLAAAEVRGGPRDATCEKRVASVPFLRFARALLEGDPDARLGDADVRDAEFFASVEWDALERGGGGLVDCAVRTRGAQDGWILFRRETPRASGRRGSRARAEKRHEDPLI